MLTSTKGHALLRCASRTAGIKGLLLTLSRLTLEPRITSTCPRVLPNPDEHTCALVHSSHPTSQIASDTVRRLSQIAFATLLLVGRLWRFDLLRDFAIDRLRGLAPDLLRRRVFCSPPEGTCLALLAKLSRSQPEDIAA